MGTKLPHYFTHNCNVSSSEGSLLPLWKFRYVEGDEEEEEADALGRREPLEITSLRLPTKQDRLRMNNSTGSNNHLKV